MKAIAYSIFGAKRQRREGCFSFESYLRGLLLNIRFNRLIYPGWTNAVMVEAETYDAWKGLFEMLSDRGLIMMTICDNNRPLCESMLWRLKPVFWLRKNSDIFMFSHVLCRDLDSLCTYREAQAVATWMENDKVAHAITDSVSHTIPMMGGMIGFRSSGICGRMDVSTFEELLALNPHPLDKKGSDQKFLNTIIYPKMATHGDDSITQHYFKGHGNTWLSDFHTCNCWLHAVARGHEDNCPENTKIDLPEILKETNEISQHIGAAGYNSIHVDRIIEERKEEFQDIIEIEQLYPDLFYWNKK